MRPDPQEPMLITKLVLQFHGGKTPSPLKPPKKGNDGGHNKPTHSESRHTSRPQQT